MRKTEKRIVREAMMRKTTWRGWAAVDHRGMRNWDYRFPIAWLRKPLIWEADQKIGNGDYKIVRVEIKVVGYAKRKEKP